MLQILWAEVFIKGIVGAVLTVAPLTAISIAGLYRPGEGFWPRLVGAVVLAIAAGVWIGHAFPSARGAIGPAGLIPINLAAAGALFAPLVLGHAAPTRRGKLFVVASTLALLALAFLEIAHA